MTEAIHVDMARRVVLRTAELPWQPSGEWGPGSYLLNPDGTRHTPWSREGCERGAWLRLPPGDSGDASSETGCVLYVKEGAVAWLRSEAEERR